MAALILVGVGFVLGCIGTLLVVGLLMAASVSDVDDEPVNRRA